MPANAITALDDFLRSREVMEIPGNALLIRKNGRELYRQYTGDSRPDTIYRIYSMTKPLTVVTALQLWEKGLFDLEDPLSKYLPEYTDVSVWDDAAQACVPAESPVTLRQLFTMTAGFCYEGDWAEVPRRAAAIRAQLEEAHPGEGYTTQAYIRALAAAPLAFQPGTHWQYSLCHDVLGAVIEVITGDTLGNVMKKNILDPLGMQDTFFRCPAEKRSRIATHNASPEQDAKYGPSARYEAGGSGLLSTLDDYMRFAETLTRGGTSADGVQLLKKETLAMLCQDQLTPATRPDFNWSYLKGYGYGLGVRVMLDPSAAGLPGSKGEFGWCGVLGTWVLMDPKQQLTAVYMHQHYPNYEEYVQLNLRGLIYALPDICDANV